MSKLKLHYFDFDGGRGEAARLALAIGGIPFEDHRIPVSDWPARRDGTPLHALPILEVDGELITQSNAINRYVGRLAGLFPDDPLDALRCDEVMDAVEDVVTRFVATIGIEDPDELRSVREALVAGPLRLYLAYFESRLESRGGSYFAGGRLTVADLRVHVWVRNLRSGVLDHVPRDLPDRLAPTLVAQSERITALPAVVSWYGAP